MARGLFSQVTESDVNFFKSILEEHRIIYGEEELEGYNTDWIGMVRGYSSLLLKPKTTEEVSKILSYCNKRNLAVCPQGKSFLGIFFKDMLSLLCLFFFLFVTLKHDNYERS